MSVKEKEGVIKFDPSMVQYELTDKAKDIMETLKNNMFIISKVATSKDDYENFLTTLLNNMHYGFEHKEFRDCTVTYKFRDDPKEDIKWTTYRAFITNAILWYPQVLIDMDKLDESYILSDYDIKHMTPSVQKNYIDKHYMQNYITMEGLSAIIHDANYFLARISERFNPFMGISININTFRDLEKRIPEYGELMRYHVDESKQPAEIEQDIQNVSKRQMELILNDEYFNTLKAIMQPGAAKEKQLSEIQTLIGLKPNEQGQIMTRPINTNYILQGLNTIFNLYVEAVSGRTAAIINKTLMGDAGHLLITIAIMTVSAKLIKDPVDDCGGANLIPIDIVDKNVLKKINMRKYKRPGQSVFKTIDAEKDEDLIGETIWMRSPVTCGCKDHVCKECYGDLWYVNKKLNSAGAYAAFITINPVVQGLLSAKHHQGTNSDMIIFNEGFDKYFVIDSTDIVIRNDIDEIETYKLIIRVEDIETENDDDDVDVSNITSVNKKGGSAKNNSDDDMTTLGDSDGPIGLAYFTKKFYVAKYYGSKKLQEIECFEDIDKKDLYMHQDFISRMTLLNDPELGNILAVDFEDIDVSEFIFLIELQNNGVTKPMKEIEKLLSNKYHENCNTYEAIVNKMISLLISSKIDVQSVHGEMIIRQLIRRSDNKLKRPDFSKIVMRQDYEIMTVNSALKYSPSLATSLNTAFLKYQLITMSETEEKTDSSDFDQIFMRTLNLDEMVKHNSGRMDFK